MNARQCNSRGRGALGVAGGGAGGERREAGGAHRARVAAGAAAVVESVVWARLEVRLVFASLIIEAAVRRDLMPCNDKKERSAPCSGAPGHRGTGAPGLRPGFKHPPGLKSQGTHLDTLSFQRVLGSEQFCEYLTRCILDARLETETLWSRQRPSLLLSLPRAAHITLKYHPPFFK